MIFTLYVTGNDENSRVMTKILPFAHGPVTIRTYVSHCGV